MGKGERTRLVAGENWEDIRWLVNSEFWRENF